MKETKKLSTSSWLTLAAAVLGIIGLVAYSTSEVAVKQIGIIAAIAIVLNIITIVVNMKYSFGILNLSSTVSAILFHLYMASHHSLIRLDGLSPGCIHGDR